MSKPTLIPTWATDANFPADSDPAAGTPTKVAPTSGEKAMGWRPGGKPPAQMFNWWKNLVGQWIAWLDAGDVEFVDVAIADELTVGGDATVEGTLTANGPLVADDITATSITADAASIAEVEASTVTAGHLYFTEPQHLKIGAASSVDPSGTHSRGTFGQKWTLAGNANPIIYPLDLPAGAVIEGWIVYAEKASGSTYRARIYRHATDLDTDETIGDYFETSATGDVSIAPDVTQEIDLDATSSYSLVVYPSGGNFNAGDTLGHAIVSWYLPPPP